MPNAAKKFEKTILDKLTAHPLLHGAMRLGDGMEHITDSSGRSRVIHRYAVPADFLAWTKNGGHVVLIEAKRTAGASLAVRRQGEKGDGLKEHQMRALIQADLDGGIGILLVCFHEKGAVYALDGVSLAIWACGQDASGKDARKSISIEHFRSHGKCLGEERRWSLDPLEFKSSPLRVTFPDGPIFTNLPRGGG